MFEKTSDIINIDDSIEHPSTKFTIIIDRQKASLPGVNQATIVEALETALNGAGVTFLHDKHLKYPAPVCLEYSKADKADLEQVLALPEAVIQSTAVRAKPIILARIAAMIAGFFIIDDPIFSGLAISLVFVLLVSTLLTLIVIPVVYYAAMENKYQTN